MPTWTQTRFFFMAAAVSACAGCSWLDTPGGTLEGVSPVNGSVIEPVLPTAVYRTLDEQTADIYVTDLPPGRLADPNDNLAGLTGQLVHLHIFIIPLGGKTPQSPKACTATVRHVVIADGAIGVYGGGGYVDASDFGEPSLSAEIRDASLRLVEATPSFVDRLGIIQLTGSVNAQLNDRVSRGIAGRIQELTFQLAPPAAPESPARAGAKPPEKADKPEPPAKPK